MAAALRFCAARVHRCSALLSLGSSVRSSRAPVLSHYNVHGLRQPAVLAARSFTDAANSTEAEASSAADSEEIPDEAGIDRRGVKTQHRKDDSLFGNARYKRIVNKLGTITTKSTLLVTFDELLKREKEILPIQAYQLLRNCGAELMYEAPNTRVELAHFFWDKLEEQGLPKDVMLYNALLSVYIQNNHKFSPLEVLEQMQQHDLEPNRTTLVLLVQAFAQNGDIAGVFKVLEFMKGYEMPITESVYAALVTAYGKSGDNTSALGVFSLMMENGLEPGLESYSALLCNYGETGDMDAINRTIEEMQENKVYPNHQVFVSVLDTLSKFGHLNPMLELVNKRNVKTLVEADLRDLMLRFAGRGEITAAFALLGHVPRYSLTSGMTSPEFLLLRQVIMSGLPTDQVLTATNELNKQGMMKNVFETALDLSFSRNIPETSLALIQEMKAQGMTVRPHYFYPVLAAYANKGNPSGAQQVFNIMAEEGFSLDPISIGFLVKSFGQSEAADVEEFISASKDVPLSPYLLKTLAQLTMQVGNVDKLAKLLKYVETESFNKSLVTGAFEAAMKRNFNADFALNVLKKLHEAGFTSKMPVIINAIVMEVSQKANKTKEVLQFVTSLLEEGLSDCIDSRTYTSMLHWLNNHKLTEEFYEFIRVMKHHRIALDQHQYRQMIKLLAFEGKAEAAQFCFDKFKQLEKPDQRMYSHLISAYANATDGGFLPTTAAPPKIRNLERVKQLFELMKKDGLKPSPRAVSSIIIANLLLGRLEEAESVRSVYGPGSQEYKLQIEYMRAYSQRGDVARVKEIFENLKKRQNSPPSPFAYNQMIAVYKFHGDHESQQTLLQEMRDKKIAINSFTYSQIVSTYLLKQDIDGALAALKECKEAGLYATNGTCFLLLNTMAKTGKTEHFEEALEDMLSNKSKHLKPATMMQFLQGVIFGCVHAGKKDLAAKLVQEYEVQLDNSEFIKLSGSSAARGEVNAVLNCMEYMKEHGLNYGALSIPLIRAYDAVQDPKSASAVYTKLKEQGIEPSVRFREVLAQLLLKYSEPLPFQVDTAQDSSQAQLQDQEASPSEEGLPESAADETDQQVEVEREGN